MVPHRLAGSIGVTPRQCLEDRLMLREDAIERRIGTHERQAV
jgi:hypothetical protein